MLFSSWLGGTGFHSRRSAVSHGSNKHGIQSDWPSRYKCPSCSLRRSASYRESAGRSCAPATAPCAASAASAPPTVHRCPLVYLLLLLSTLLLVARLPENAVAVVHQTNRLLHLATLLQQTLSVLRRVSLSTHRQDLGIRAEDGRLPLWCGLRCEARAGEGRTKPTLFF